MPKRLGAIVFLLVFTPFFAEAIASTSAPWYSFFNPVVFLLFILLYGITALLLRELWVIKRLSFWHLVLYGAVFAALNEGIVADTWFKPNPLNFTNSEIVRFAGINWHMVVNLTIFHSLFSVLIPILLSFIIFSSLNKTTLLKPRGLKICVGLLLFVAVASLLPKHHVAVADFNYRAILLLILVVVSVIGVLIHPSNRSVQKAGNYSPNTLLKLGASYTTLFVFSYFILPKLIPEWSILFSIALYIAGLVLAYRISRTSDNDSKKILALIGGLMLPSIVLSLTKTAFLQPVVIGLFLAYLWKLYKNPKASDIW